MYNWRRTARGVDEVVRIEVCVESLFSALEAEAGGASRLELCDCLLVGGTTPSFGLQQTVLERTNLPVHVLIRPRAGDFCYDDNELLVMERDIVAAKQLGAAGVVFGVLSPEGSINKRALSHLVALARPMCTTFHRAFDLAACPTDAIEDVIDIGMENLLTSGQETTAIDGKGLIAELIKQAAGRINIMPGGGIDEKNVAELVASTGALYIHMSARVPTDSRMIFRRNNLSMGTWREDEFRYLVADRARVRAILEAAQSGNCAQL